MAAKALIDTLRGADLAHVEVQSLETMRRDIARLIGKPASEVGDQSDLMALGLESVGVMTLASIWRSTGTELKFAELVERRTLAEWWTLASSRLRATSRDHENPIAVDETAPFGLDTMQ